MPNGLTTMKLPTAGSKPYTPRDYQKLGIKKMVTQACAGLLLDPGLGKTSISLAATKILRSKPIIKGVLIIAPLRVIYDVWPAEIEKWQDFKDIDYTLLHGKEKWDNLDVEADIYLINPEAVPLLVEELKLRDEWPFDTLIVDESTKFKAPNSKRFKALRKLIPFFRRRYILTGTITPNGLLDLFGQIYILDAGASLGPYITHYKNAFFYPSGYGNYTWLPREGAMEEISQRVAPLVLRMRAEDYLDLPPLVPTYKWLELPAPARKVYKDLEEEFMTELGDDVILAPSAAAAAMKCRQVLNGALYINEEHDWKTIHDIKLDALEEFVESLAGQPLLIFYEFNHDRERIIERLGWSAIGHQSPKEDSKVIKAFNAGLLPGVIAHPASAGHGLNLQGACAHVAWFGLTWNLEHYDQGIKRVHRQGNEAQRVIAHHFCIKDSLDEVVVKVLKAKDRTQTKFMEAVRALASPTDAC
jgi:SNF2 family DNA or RNA helicase